MVENNSKKPIIIHIFNQSTFFHSFFHFVEKHFDTTQHIILTNSGDQHDAGRDISEFYNKYKILYKHEMSFNRAILLHPFKALSSFFKIKQIKELSKADLLLLHGFTPDMIRCYILKPSLLKKTAWGIWGFDLYDYRERNKSFYTKIQFAIKKLLVKRIPYILSMPEDRELLQKWYNASPKLYQVYSSYGSGTQNVQRHFRADNSKTINILLGNSASTTNRHRDALQLLDKYKNEDIHIYIPLTYGDMDYAKIISDEAYKIFKNKVTILTQQLPIDKYNAFLSTIDIVVFNQNRQQGMGNLIYLFQSGAKIYLNTDNPLYLYFTKELGLSLNDVNNISRMNYEEFISTDKNETEKTVKKAQQLYSEEMQIKQWSEIFELANKK